MAFLSVSDLIDLWSDKNEATSHDLLKTFNHWRCDLSFEMEILACQGRFKDYCGFQSVAEREIVANEKYDSNLRIAAASLRGVISSSFSSPSLLVGSNVTWNYVSRSPREPASIPHSSRHFFLLDFHFSHSATTHKFSSSCMETSSGYESKIFTFWTTLCHNLIFSLGN